MAGSSWEGKLDDFIRFYLQLEARDKINKVFQNLFRALSRGAFSKPESCSRVSPLDAEWRLRCATISRAFEDARVVSWLLKSIADFKGIYVQITRGTVPGALLNGGSVWTEDAWVFRLLMASRIVMTVRWCLENIRLLTRWGLFPADVPKALSGEREESMNKAPMKQMFPKHDQALANASSHKWNVRAKWLWVANVAFAFSAEAVRLFQLLRGKKSDGKPGGSIHSTLIAMLFYALDGHAAATLVGLRDDSDERVGFCMVGASLLQLYNMAPSANEAYARAAKSPS